MGLQEDGLSDVTHMLSLEKTGAERRLRVVLEDLGSSCSKYVTHSQNKLGGSAGKTKLDKERQKMCQREAVSSKTVFLKYTP